jgi:hypothetical protein
VIWVAKVAKVARYNCTYIHIGGVSNMGSEGSEGSEIQVHTYI